MERDVQFEALKKRLSLIEKNIEEDNVQARMNRIPARYFMLFFLIGAEEEMCSVLERKVKELLCNPDSCEFLQIKEDDGVDNGEVIDYGTEAERLIEEAARNHCDVQDLNTVFLCPVIFSDGVKNTNIIEILKNIDSIIAKAGHQPVWQPSMILNKNISQYENIYSCINDMSAFILSMPDGRVNRCCLLSNIDENGFSVPKESILQTVAMIVVLQNVVIQSSDDSQTIRKKVARNSTLADAKHLFFTARNAAITNPVRSLLLQRMISAVDHFSGKNDDKEVLSKIDYSFVNKIVDEYINRLPQYNGKITFFPLYGVMNDAMLHSRLKKIIKDLYYEPIYGENVRNEQIKAAKTAFLQEYFMSNGSLEELEMLIRQNGIEHELLNVKQKCYKERFYDYPDIDKKQLMQYKNSEYENAQIYCHRFISNSGWDLMEQVGNQLYNPDMLQSICNVKDCIEQIKSCLASRLRQLKEVETVLVVDQTESRSSLNDVQRGWFENEVLNNPKEYQMYDRAFDKVIYSLLQDGNEDCCALLDVCYNAVKKSANLGNYYLDRVSTECMANDDRAAEFVTAVEKSWCYTLRFLQRDESTDVTCIIGDEQNNFCKVLKSKFRGSLFSFSGFDRIDVLHVSSAFSPENILEWELIKSVEKGGEDGESR